MYSKEEIICEEDIYKVISLQFQSCNNTCPHSIIASDCGCFMPQYFQWYSENQREELPRCKKTGKTPSEKTLN